MAESGRDLPCPFCRDTQQPREEYVVASPERIFLVSTSRTPGVSDDDTRTIHVLKDITDRREAERRYRELFDSIQEGLFFATSDGRFLDVNDAMVRMLGYASREELLRADVGPHLYPAPDVRERFLQALEERGVLRNYEETLRRKDGTLLHTLQNIIAHRGDILQRVQQCPILAPQRLFVIAQHPSLRKGPQEFVTRFRHRIQMRANVRAQQFLPRRVPQHAHHRVIYVQESPVRRREEQSFLDAVKQLAVPPFRLPPVRNVLQNMNGAGIVVRNARRSRSGHEKDALRRRSHVLFLRSLRIPAERAR